MSVSQQMDLRLKMHKIFDTCQLSNNWKRNEKSSSREYIAQEDGSSIVLNLIQANLTETFSFKKGSHIVLKDSLMEYYNKDLMQ